MLSESRTLPRTRRSCFIIFCFMARGQSPITIVSFCSFGLKFICCSHVLGYDKIKWVKFSSRSRLVTCVRFHWNLIFIRNFSYWKGRQLASKIVAALSEQNISQALCFENSLFRVKQLTILLAVQEVLYILISSNLLMHMQCNVIRAIAIQSFFPVVLLQVYL